MSDAKFEKMLMEPVDRRLHDKFLSPEDNRWVVKDSGHRRQFDLTGAQRDMAAGKGRYDLISPFALKRWAQRMEGGAEKYGDRNWEKGMPMHVFMDSAKRHLDNYLSGDRSEDHLAAVLFNVGALIHQEELRDSYPAELFDLPDYTQGEA